MACMCSSPVEFEKISSPIVLESLWFSPRVSLVFPHEKQRQKVYVLLFHLRPH